MHDSKITALGMLAVPLLLQLFQAEGTEQGCKPGRLWITYPFVVQGAVLGLQLAVCVVQLNMNTLELLGDGDWGETMG